MCVCAVCVAPALTCTDERTQAHANSGAHARAYIVENIIPLFTGGGGGDGDGGGRVQDDDADAM